MCAGEAGGAQPIPNLSNKLNPNNVHYDRDAAVHYKGMSKADKEALWATERLRDVPYGGMGGLQGPPLHDPLMGRVPSGLGTMLSGGALSTLGGEDLSQLNPSQLTVGQRSALLQRLQTMNQVCLM